MNKIIFTDGEELSFALLTQSKINLFQDLIQKRYPDITLSLFGCTYKSEKYIGSYLANLDSSSMRSRTLVILTIIHRGPVPSIYSGYFSFCKEKGFPAILLVLDSDPGLYNCWNYSIMISPTEYLGNANPDDVRFPLHDEICIDALTRDDSHIVATCLYFSSNYRNLLDVDGYIGCDIAFRGTPANPTQNDLFRYKDNSVKPSNIFHCMPIWKRSVHEICGFFNEDRYGTYADWALWLQFFSHQQAKASFVNEILGAYLVDPCSHNRIYPNISVFAKNIFSDLLLPVSRCQEQGDLGVSANLNVLPNTFICNIAEDRFGSHRSDFNIFASDVAAALQPSPTQHSSQYQSDQQLRIIPFIEKYFGWGCSPGEAGSIDPRPILEPWVGVFHVPFDYPCFIEPLIAPRNILQSRLFRDSIPNLRYLIFLSESMRLRYSQLYPHMRIPTCSIKFYTSHGEACQSFDWSLFEKHQRVIHVGDWLRCFRSFYSLKCDLKKIILKKESTNKYMTQLSEYLYNGYEWLARPNGSLESISMVSSLEYDFLLSSSVVFVRLFDTSANNLLTECVDRCTPLVINRLPAAVEYLGSDYPLFYDSLIDAEALLGDMSMLHEGHQYMIGLRKGLHIKKDNEAALQIVSNDISKSLYFNGLIFD